MPSFLGKKRWPCGVACDHPGCLSHTTHPCEGCGRIAGRYGLTPKEQLQERCQGPGDADHINRLLGIIEELYEALVAAETIGDFPEELRERYELKKFNETLQAKIPTHIYCEICGIQPVIIEPAHTEDISGKYIGGDLVCDTCKLVIATHYREKP